VTSADKLGMIVAVSVVIIFVGIGVGMSGVSEPVKVTQPVSDRPDVQQQAIPAKGSANVPKGIVKEQQDSKNLSSIIPKLIPPKIQFKELCGDGIDNDNDGLVDEIPEPGPVVNFRNCDLRGLDLSNQNLVGSNFRGLDLTDTNLEGANLKNANFQRTTLIETHLENANLEGANFQRADIQGSYFDGANLSHVNFKNAKLIGNYVCDVNLKGANFQGALLDHSYPDK
jgi:uncharacterized protein YjbI with pentapeptide repeats